MKLINWESKSVAVHRLRTLIDEHYVKMFSTCRFAMAGQSGRFTRPARQVMCLLV
jgi:hypothetical protein